MSMRYARPVPFLKGAVPKQYSNVVEGIQTLNQMTRETQGEGLDSSALQPCVTHGERIRQDLLAHLHKTARTDTYPDLRAVTSSLRSWNNQVMATTQRTHATR